MKKPTIKDLGIRIQNMELENDRLAKAYAKTHELYVNCVKLKQDAIDESIKYKKELFDLNEKHKNKESIGHDFGSPKNTEVSINLWEICKKQKINTPISMTIRETNRIMVALKNIFETAD